MQPKQSRSKSKLDPRWRVTRYHHPTSIGIPGRCIGVLPGQHANGSLNEAVTSDNIGTAETRSRYRSRVRFGRRERKIEDEGEISRQWDVGKNSQLIPKQAPQQSPMTEPSDMAGYFRGPVGCCRRCRRVFGCCSRERARTLLGVPLEEGEWGL